ncbi:MAG: serine hydrolase, partial [Cyclobacteriaceae bacterium]|nr:serine hydrolase [Cyclobacteriaceae bacterium]
GSKNNNQITQFSSFRILIRKGAYLYCRFTKLKVSMLKKSFCSILLLLSVFASQAQDARQHWVDSVFSTLSVNEKIGQLFFIPVSSSDNQTKTDLVLSQVKNQQVGGIIVTGGGPVRHAQLINKFQKASKIPLLIGASAEWGLAQTLDSVPGFQKPMAAGALPTDSLYASWASAIAHQMNTLGVNINLAPNVDDRLLREEYLRFFGDSPPKIAQRASAFAKAMRDEKILSVAKHLTLHEELPTIADTSRVINLADIDSTEFLTLRSLIDEGVDGILTRDLRFSVRGENGILPVALSRIFITDVLKRKLNFKGLVFTDVRDFQKAVLKDKPGEAELLAFTLGNDVLLGPLSVSQAVKRIAKEVKNKKNKALLSQLDETVRKILAAKYNVGLYDWKPISTDNLHRRLYSPENNLLARQLSENIVTLVSNKDETLPIELIEDKTFACISIGQRADNEFTHMLEKYVPVKKFSILSPTDTSQLAMNHTVVIINIGQYAYDLEAQLSSWLPAFASKHKAIVCHFGSPFSLDRYKGAGALIAAYTDGDEMNRLLPQVIFGALPARGVLPVENTFTEAAAIRSLDRFSYTLPEQAGVDSRTLEKIKPILEEAIASGATPGCHVLVARHGKVIYEQSAGSLTYENTQTVTDETIYDLASVTKVTATLQTVMFMQEKGLIDINKKASVYLPELRESNKKDFTIKDILTHQAGLWPFLPFWAQTMDIKESLHLPEYYASSESQQYPLPVSGNLFAARSMKDSLWQWIINAKVREKPARTPYDYRYSDMGFYILQHLAEKMLNQPMEDFLEQNLYGPLGAYTTGYLPLTRFPAEHIAPTEQDTLFRKTLLTGYVHDQGAAMHGGIAGHAGLFSTANDLAKLGQLWLQKGHYGGLRYYKPETLELFTQKQFENSRRGLGWDKPTQSDWSGPTSLYASPKTFGHTGFTGTCIWVDPEFDLVYVFLSNRVHPDMNNNKLINASIRPRVQDVVYQAIFNYCANKKPD